MARWRRYETGDENTRKIQDASRDAFGEIDTERSFGSVEEVSSDTKAKLGKYYFFEKPSANVTLTLPKITRSDAGRTVSVKVGDSATTTVTIVATGDNVTVNGSASESKSSGQFVTYMVINNTLWIQVS